MAPDRGQKPPTSRAWDALTPELSTWILDATANLGFERMTPVQASAIPLFMTHKDVVVEAVTGSGKTLAFLIPVIEKLLRIEEPSKKHHVGAIIISPTRELATQIYNVLKSLLAFHGLSAGDEQTDNMSHREESGEVSISSKTKIITQLLLGGSFTAAQDLSTFLKTSPNLLISTPGRLLEILSSPYVHCPQSSFEMLVMDEADRLLDLGFKDDLTKILRLLPKQRRTGLFSASVSEAVDQLIRVGLRNPVRIAVKVKSLNGAEDKRTPASLQMSYLVTKPAEKLAALSKLLHRIQPTPLKAIIFLSTCAAVDYFQHLLPSLLPTGTILVPLHGKHPSQVRQKNFVRFTNSASPAVLLTTDVAARGLDVPSVDLVVQLDPPSDPKAFLHRCGRAGRAGRRGLAVIFLHPGTEEDYVSFLDIRKTPVEQLASPEVNITNVQTREMAAQLRGNVLQDRALLDKAQRAFVSWVRSYSKHEAHSIFRVSELDWASLAEGWALLKLPKMPELKNWDREAAGYEPVAGIDWDTYAYKDKAREKQRLEALQQYKENGPPTKKQRVEKNGSSVAWSQKLDEKKEREGRREKKHAKREFEKNSMMTEDEKERTAKTGAMIAEVRKQFLENKEADFEGFGD